MHRGRGDFEVPLDVRFGRWPSQHPRIGVDERQVLPLFFGKARGLHNN